MKRKWLIAIASLAMVVTLAFGFAACQPEENGGPSDEEIAQSGITTLNGIYLDSEGKVKDYETPDDYSVVSRVKVEDEFYAVSWSVSSDTENIAQYVSIATEADSSSQYTIDITRATFDIEYKLTASITVGKVTKTTSYSYKIPKKSSEDAVTASLSFETTNARTSQTSEQQVWEQNGIKVTNLQGSGSAIKDYFNPVRWYKNSIVRIEFPNLIHVDFHSKPNYTKSDQYLGRLEGALKAVYADAEVTVNEETNTVSIHLANPVNSLEFTCTEGQCQVYSLDVEGLAGELSDAQKVAAAKASLKLAQTLYFEQNTVTLTTESNGATIAWSIKETTTNASIESGKLKVTTLPTAEIKLTLVATITSSEESDSAEFPITLKPQPTLKHKGTQADPYSAADVIAISNLLESGSYYMKDGANAKIYVKGYIIAGTWSSTYNNFDKMYIADSDTSTTDSADALQIFGLGKDDQFIIGDTLVMGASITILGGIQNYSGKAEIALQPQTVALEDSRTPNQKVTAALAGLKDITVTQTGDVELTTSSGSVAFTWALKSGENLPDGTMFANNKLTVTKLPATDTTVKFVVTAKLTGATDQTKEISVTIKAQTEPTPGKGDGTVNHPYSVAEATAIIAGLGTETVYKVNGQIALVYVKGIVTVKGNTDNYGIKNYFMADVAGDTENDICLYSLNWGTVKNAEINVGDTIIVTGYLQNFNGTYEVSSYKDTSWHNGTVEAHTPAGGTVDPDPQPTEGLIYTLTSTTKGENANASDINSYTASSPCTVDGITWDVLGNTQIGSGQYDIPNWRFGGKSGNCNSADRTITGRGAINGTVKSIVITFGGTSGSITVNSVTLKVYSTDPGTGSPTPIAEKTVEWTQNGTYTVTADDAGWTDCYYQLVMNLTSSNASSNKWIAVDNIKFYGGESSVEPQPQPENNGTAEHPFKPSEAVAYGKENLATSGATTTAEVYVKGYVIDKGSWNGTCWQYVYIADDPTYTTKNNADSVIEVYKLYPDSTYLILSGDLIKGREITVHGYLKNYTDKSNKTTYEFDDYTKDDASVHPVASFASTLTREEKLNAAKAAIGNLASDDVISGFDLPAVTVSDVSYAWTVTPTMYAQIVTTQNVSKLQITRPENGTGNQTVTLSLTITCDGTAEQTPLTWELTIKQKPSTTIESELYILPTAHQTSGSNSSYTGNCDVTYNGVKWNIEGNSQSSPWRFGGKASNSTTPLTADRKLTGKTAIQGKVSKVLLTLTDGGGITVNSVTLKVYKTDPTSNGAEAVSTKTVTTYTKDQTITFTAEEGEDWTNCYFEITFNVTITSTSNKYVAISNLEFRGTAVKE